MNARRDLERIFDAATGAVDPARLVEENLYREGPWVSVRRPGQECLRWRGTCLVVGAGKAAARMAAGCESSLGTETVRGRVVTADGCTVPLARLHVDEAAHPMSDERGAKATQAICEMVAMDGRDPVLCLISGGASSLLVRPRASITLEDKIETVRALYACGADINELNTVRKHLSAVKGGELGRIARSRPVVTLILSDVVGDDPAVIGSGPTVADPTTFADACGVLDRFELWEKVPPGARKLLRTGVAGELPETVKPAAGPGRQWSNIVIGSNRTAIQAAATEASRLGYEVSVDAVPLCGDTRVAATRWARNLRLVEATGRTVGRWCFIAGGETTVEVKGTGRGGRNQEFALAMAGILSNSRATVLSAGTDGIDGPTDAAGAFVDGSTAERSCAVGLDAAEAMDNNDSHGFFDRLGDLFRPGPTGTNVMDLKIAVVESG